MKDCIRRVKGLMTKTTTVRRFQDCERETSVIQIHRVVFTRRRSVAIDFSRSPFVYCNISFLTGDDEASNCHCFYDIAPEFRAYWRLLEKFRNNGERGAIRRRYFQVLQAQRDENYCRRLCMDYCRWNSPSFRDKPRWWKLFFPRVWKRTYFKPRVNEINVKRQWISFRKRTSSLPSFRRSF